MNKENSLTKAINDCLDITPHILFSTREVMSSLYDYPKTGKVLSDKDIDVTPYNFVLGELFKVFSRLNRTCHIVNVNEIKTNKESKIIYIDYSITNKYTDEAIFYANLALNKENGSLVLYKSEKQNKNDEVFDLETVITLINKNGKWTSKEQSINEKSQVKPIKNKRLGID